MPSQEITTILESLLAQPRPEGEVPLAVQRAGYDALGSMFPLADDITVTPVDAGGVAAEWLEPAGVEAGRTVVYFHGGGYVTGSCLSHRELASRIARAAAATVLSVDYRLAPEHPWPAQVEDGTTAYGWLLAEGHDPQRTALAGDSAGGGLVVATLLSLRDAGTPLPAAAVCMSPWTNLDQTDEQIEERATRDPMIPAESLITMAGQFLGGADPRHPLVSPALGDLSGLPPVLVQVGTAELLLEDSRQLAEGIRAAGGDVTLEEYEELIHVFQQLAPTAPETVQAVGRIGEFIAKHAA